MAVKTITVTQEAYNALKGLKGEQESFSQTILRVSRKRCIWDFAGAISPQSANLLEKRIKERRMIHAKMKEGERKRIVSALEGR